MKEIWKEIKESNMYLVSNKGKVIKSTTKKVLKKRLDKDGYEIVCLYINGKTKQKKVHRLVAQAFILNPNNYPQVNHKDENKQNNKAENLEWCTNKYNSNYGNRNRLISNRRTNFVIVQKDLNYNFIKLWDDIYELKYKSPYNYQHIRDFIRKNLKPKEFIWEKYFKY